MNNSVIVSLRDIVVEFDGQRILDGLNLDIHDKEFVTLLGSSGCGKTTTLRLIAGFLEPTSGKVLLKGEDITGVPPYKRPVNTVFQKYALFPHLNVFENVAFGLRLKKMDEETIRRKVRDMLEEFIMNTQLILPALGHKVFEPQPSADEDEPDNLFYFSRNQGKGGQATGKVADDGFWVLKGSYIYPHTADYLPSGVVKARQRYVDLIDNQGMHLSCSVSMKLVILSGAMILALPQIRRALSKPVIFAVTISMCYP